MTIRSVSMRGVARVASAAVLLSSCPRFFILPVVNVGGGTTLATPAGWSQVPWPGTTAIELLRTQQTAAGVVHEGRIMVLTEQRLSHDEAVDRLGQISAEAPGATFLLIDGWPGLQRRQVVVVPPPGAAKVGGGRPEKVMLVTTAVAAGDLVIRAEGSVQEGNAAVATEVEAIGRSLKFAARADPAKSEAELRRLRDAAPRPVVNPVPSKPQGTNRNGPSTPAPGAPSIAAPSFIGELEVAASGDGRQVVVAGQGTATFFSTDAGLTFKRAAFPLPAGFGNRGDPSIAIGASGVFYVAFLGAPSGGACTASVMASPPGSGASFSFVANAAMCPGSGNPQCFPDQEHIAADPNPSTTGTDQLYVVWRHFTPIFGGNCPTSNLNFPTPTIACSSNGGVTWSAPAPIAGGDVARVTVGGDGSVWVVQRNGGWIAISKYSSCERGLVMQAGFPKNVAPVSEPSCPVAGLDRCSGPDLSSAMVAVDRGDPNHVYIAYGNATSNANDDITVVDSTDGFATWPVNGRSVIVSGSAVGRRFMPWACTLGGSVQVGWYDRRAATPSGNDLTAYFRGSASVQSGALMSGTEVNVSISNDPQCATAFPCGERNLADADSCPTVQFDGTCDNNTNNGSKTPCDQDIPSCPPGEACVPNGGNFGCPKYGDYNGIACAAGHVFAAWASATPPPGLLRPSGIGVFVDALPCGTQGQPCCLSGPACGGGLSCTAGTCTIGACGSTGQPCCGGNSCTAGNGCASGTCVACPPPPRTLVDSTAHNGSDCFGTSKDYDFGSQACDAGFRFGTCTATLVSQANGSTCSATPLGGCRCRARVTTPADCSKWATCRVVITENPVAPAPIGCPGGPQCGGSGQACCSSGAPCNPGFSCTAGVCAAVSCGAAGQVCCASGAACSPGLSCTAGGVCAVVSCGAAGQACCSGNTCNAGNACASGACVVCPSAPKTLADTTAHNGSDCGGTSHDYFFGNQTCDPGFQLGTCTATLSSQANGSTCSAAPAGGCRCKVHVTTPADCFKWADCHVVVSEIPAASCP